MTLSAKSEVLLKVNNYKSTMSKIEVIVKIEDSHADKISEIADKCRAAGMQVESKMSAVGMITGKIEAANIGKIERITGVSYVEESKLLS